MANYETQVGANRRRAFLLVAALFILMTAVSIAAGAYFDVGGVSLIMLAVVFSVGATWVSWWKADRIVLAMTRARVVGREEAPQLYNLVEEVCIAAGLPLPKIAIVDDPAPNAFATGRDPEHAVVAFTSGLLNIMDREELQGVAAHELAHVANRDTLVMTIAATTAGIIALISDLAIRLVLSGGRRERDSKGNPLVLAAVVLAIVLAPIAAALLKGALSRSREGLADATAVKFTRNPAGLRRALQKLAGDTAVVRSRSAAVAHLWIECPLDKKRSMNRWFATHPPIEERVMALWAMEGHAGMPPPVPGTAH